MRVWELLPTLVQVLRQTSTPGRGAMIRHTRSFARKGLSTWQKSLQILTIFTTLTASSAFADTVIWIGRPTVQDYMAYSARQAIEGYQQLQQQIAVFNAQIADARQAYFAAPPANRATLGDKFGELLLQKDLLIAMPDVMTGGGDQAKAVTGLMLLANKGNLPDGGIPPSARAAFGQWVTALQMRAGSSFGRMPDPVKASQAMLDGGNLEAYEKYRRLRDQAEFDEFEAQQNGGVRKLLDHGSISARGFIGTTDAAGLDYRVKSLDDKVLRCTYAGMGPNYYFWQGQPPQDITSLLAMNYTVHNGALDLLKDHAADECPADSKQASVLAAAPLKEPLTPVMLKDGKAQAHAAPQTPEQQAQQAQARQQAQDRQTKTATRADAFRACNEEMNAALQIARLTRDRAVTQAAHQRNLQCMSAARSLSAQ
jgi:hypothetical protein